MRKIIKALPTIIVSLLLAGTAYGASTLYQYYTEQGQQLPSISNRASIALEAGIDNYSGTASQNDMLLRYLQGSKELLGTNLPQQYALIDTYLASSISKTDTSMTLASGTTSDGASLSGRTCFIIDVNTPTAEFVCGTAAGTAITGLERGIKASDPTATSSALAFSHRRFSSVQVTDFPFNQLVQRLINGTDSFPNAMTFDSLLTYNSSLTFTPGSNQLASVYYADSVANQGAATSSESIGGIAELATQAEMGAGTDYGANRPLVLQAKYASSTASTTGMIVPIAGSDGKLDQSFLDLTENYTWTANHIFSGSVSTTATTTVTQVPVNDYDVVNKIYNDNFFSFGYFTASDNLKYSSNSEYATNTTSFVKVKEVRVNRGGTVRVKYEIKTSDVSGAAQGQVYVNSTSTSEFYPHSAIGYGYNDTNTSYATSTATSIRVNPGDLVQLYILNGSASYTTSIRNFGIYYDLSTSTADAVVNTIY